MAHYSGEIESASIAFHIDAGYVHDVYVVNNITYVGEITLDTDRFMEDKEN